jgi:hypothetical protein
MPFLMRQHQPCTPQLQPQLPHPWSIPSPQQQWIIS